MGRYVNPVQQILDGNGDPLVGAKLFFYEPGTTTLKTVFSDSGLTTSRANPVISDANGRWGVASEGGAIFLDGIYRVIGKDKNDVLIPGLDNDPVGDVIEGEWQLWISGTIYNKPQIVTGSDDEYYRSLIDANQGNDPTSSPAQWEKLSLGRIWNTNITYGAGDSVYGSDGYLYISRAASNSANDPTTNPDKWSDFREDTPGKKNLLVGWDFRLNPFGRGSSFTAATTPNNNNDTYTADQTLLLSDGNDIIDITQDTDGSIKLDVETANLKFGIFQPLTNKKSLEAIKKGVASISIEAKSTGISNLRAAVVSWDSTADTITSDIVSAWNAAGSNPTLVANWTFENTAANLALTSSYQTFTIEAILIDTASTTNVGFFIWIDDDDAIIGETVNILRAKLETGYVATAFEAPNQVQIEEDCHFHFNKTYDRGVAPGTVTNNGALRDWAGETGTEVSNAIFQYPVRMFGTPTVTTYNPNSGATGSWRAVSIAADLTASVDNIGDLHVSITNSGVLASISDLRIHVTTESVL